jgi:hypothetical protein
MRRPAPSAASAIPWWIPANAFRLQVRVPAAAVLVVMIPLGPDPATNTFCYRGPLDSFLLANPAWLMESDDPWPPGSNGLYDWWTTLEIRDQRPILYIRANLVAG